MTIHTNVRLANTTANVYLSFLYDPNRFTLIYGISQSCFIYDNQSLILIK